MNIKNLLSLIFVALWTPALIACGIEVAQTPETYEPAATPEPMRTYLQATVAPCTPVEGTEVDPCARRETWNEHPAFDPYDFYVPDTPMTLKEALVFLGPSQSPHMAIRAVALPGTIRCQFSAFLSVNSGADPNATGPSGIYCYADFEVRDYIVGTGP